MRAGCAQSLAASLLLALLPACERSVEAPPGPPFERRALPAEPGTGRHYVHSAWATVHRDSRNSDYVPLSPGADVELAWTALDGAALFVGPVFGPEGRLFVSSGRGQGTSHLHAFDREGQLLWESPPMQTLQDLDYVAVVCAPIVDGTRSRGTTLPPPGCAR